MKSCDITAVEKSSYKMQSVIVAKALYVFLCRYRGLQSFHSSLWDPKENLPPNYARIFQFDNFRRTQKRVLSNSENEDGIMVSIVCVDVES